jgi:hypothetical protein
LRIIISDLNMSLGKPEIKQSNMDPHMEQFATEQAAGALSLLFHE